MKCHDVAKIINESIKDIDENIVEEYVSFIEEKLRNSIDNDTEELEYILADRNERY